MYEALGGMVHPEISDRQCGWGTEMEQGRWSGFIVNENLTLVYLSVELLAFLEQSLGRDPLPEDVGLGLNIFVSLTCEAWTKAMDEASIARVVPRALSYWKDELQLTGLEAVPYVPDPLLPMLEAAEPVRSSGVFVDRFQYTSQGQPPLQVEYLISVQRDPDGIFAGAFCLNQVSLRPTLISLLARGDERMFERMADLAEPRRCQGAVLFADLQGSTRLSRTLPTAAYFSLIRSLAAGMDAAIAANGGVVGKHAGDGVSGFFLLSEGGEPSKVAGAALRAAREIHDHAAQTLERTLREAGAEVADHAMNIGVHWGGSIFMGQLVPGGRLDVTALGDAVNECARIQEAAHDGAIFASKHLIEHLNEKDAADVDIDLDHLTYQMLADLPGAPDKAKQDAGSIPVTKLR